MKTNGQLKTIEKPKSLKNRWLKLIQDTGFFYDTKTQEDVTYLSFSFTNPQGFRTQKTTMILGFDTKTGDLLKTDCTQMDID